MYQGIVGDCITCKNCKKPKYKFETELILSLPLDNRRGASQNGRRIDGLSAAGSGSGSFDSSFSRRNNVTLSKSAIPFDDCL